MKVLLDPKIESTVDRVADLAVVAIVLVALVGIFTAQTEVPLQFDNEGFTGSVPPVLAAAVYTFMALFMRLLARSSHPLVRWLGRLLVLFILAFEIVAVTWAS